MDPKNSDATQESVSKGSAPSSKTGEREEKRAEARSGVKGVLSRLRPPGAATIPRQIDDIVHLIRAQHPKTDAREIVRAYELAAESHRGQTRLSGEDFIEHPVGVARILAELGMDQTTIIAAFLHDAVEDTQLTREEIRQAFGEEVADIIDGLTKIEKIGFRSREQERADNLRKMIVAMAQDLRVLIIKLADRLHNMRTVSALPALKQELVSRETLEIYAPLAHRLGMQQVRGELEDLAFLVLHPRQYEEIERMVIQRQPARQEYLSKVIAQVKEKLREVKIKAEITGRPKHYYSIYEKMVGRGREFDEIFDLVGVRIIVESLKDCYAVLGAIHSRWTPVPGRFKDYIATAKFNLYQSLHTTVVGPEGKPLEIQIRTQDMHRVAEWGVAAHWQYKEGSSALSGDEQSAWMRRMLDLQQTEDDVEFLETLKLDLFADEVFVFTPKGDVVQIPKGSTPLDFAYSIHTEVGHACVGAKVDGKLVPLSYQLSSGESVEVMTSKSSIGPSRDWLDIVATPRARTKIKQWFTKERRDEAITEGRDALQKALRRAGIPIQKTLTESKLNGVLSELRLASTDALYAEVGEGRLSAQTVIAKIMKDLVEVAVEEAPAATPQKVRTKPPSSQGVMVAGLDDTWVKLARCCMPVPGDAILGFITRGRGVSVHRTDCPNVKDLSSQGERIVEANWNPNLTGVYLVSIQVEALDRPKLLRDVTTTISDFGMNIISATSSVGQGLALLRFTFELAGADALPKILASVRKVESVYDAYRITPSRS